MAPHSELAFSLAAALREQQEMAVANIVGANMFNLLDDLGLTGLVRPIPVDPGTIAVDLWVAMGVTLLCCHWSSGGAAGPVVAARCSWPATSRTSRGSSQAPASGRRPS